MAREIEQQEKGGERMKRGAKVTTKQLVEELKTREGVETIIAEPYEKKTVEIEGPAIILIVED